MPESVRMEMESGSGARADVLDGDETGESRRRRRRARGGCSQEPLRGKIYRPRQCARGSALGLAPPAAPATLRLHRPPIARAAGGSFLASSLPPRRPTTLWAPSHLVSPRLISSHLLSSPIVSSRPPRPSISTVRLDYSASALSNYLPPSLPPPSPIPFSHTQSNAIFYYSTLQHTHCTVLQCHPRQPYPRSGPRLSSAEFSLTDPHLADPFLTLMPARADCSSFTTLAP